MPGSKILSNEDFRLIVFKSKGINVLVVLKKIMIASQIKDNFIDVVFRADGWTKCSYQSIRCLKDVTINDRLDDTVVFLLLFLLLVLFWYVHWWYKGIVNLVWFDWRRLISYLRN